MAKNAELLHIMDLVGPALNEARAYGLQIEVVSSIIQKMREIPEKPLETVISEALGEWDL